MQKAIVTLLSLILVALVAIWFSGSRSDTPSTTVPAEPASPIEPLPEFDGGPSGDSPRGSRAGDARVSRGLSEAEDYVINVIGPRLEDLHYRVEHCLQVTQDEVERIIFDLRGVDRVGMSREQRRLLDDMEMGMVAALRAMLEDPDWQEEDGC